MNFVTIWIQGSGKWTQGRILVEEYGFELYESGWALREIAKKDTDLWRDIKATIEAGKHVSPEKIEDILMDIIENSKAEFKIFDGFLRNEWNKATCDKALGDYKVLFFDLPKEVAVERLTTRMYDPETQETFMAWTTHNPKTGAELVQRKDDNIDSIMERIDLFYNVTMPVVEELRKDGRVIEINALGTLEEVTKEIATKLNLK